MTQLAWATDLHLNFVSEAETTVLCERLARSEAQVLLLGGDIGEAGDLADYLDLFATSLPQPIYFVLGNHDAGGSRRRRCGPHTRTAA